MPLQKPPPQGLSAPDPRTSKRRHIQERRRTLQTISELSIDETAPLKLRVTFGTNQMAPSDRSGTSGGTKTSNINKRRSLPQYSTRSNYADPRSAPPVPPIRQTHMQHSMKTQASPSSSDKYEAGWNARRERARTQAEQALAGSRQTGTNYKYMHGKHSTSSIRPSAHQFAQDHPSLKSTSSQQQLLQNSRSITGTPRSDRRYSFGNSPKSEHRDYEGESSERASTDSSSQQSAYETAVRRSRSGSSTRSARSIPHPPMPASMLQVPPRMYTNPYYGIGYAIPQPTCFTAQHIHQDRSISLPIMTLDYPVAHYVDHLPRSHSSNAHEAPAKHRAGHVRSRHQQPYDGRGSVRALQQHPLPSRPSSDRRRTRSQSSLKSALPAHINSPPPAYTASVPSTNVVTDQNPDKLALPPPAMAADHRAVPNRENLTKWKTEREEARAEFDGIQRAKMKERVRRANELELEKERELRRMGKGMANEKACRVLGRDVDDVEGEMVGEKREMVVVAGGGTKSAKGEKQRGCFGGLFGMLVK